MSWTAEPTSDGTLDWGALEKLLHDTVGTEYTMLQIGTLTGEGFTHFRIFFGDTKISFSTVRTFKKNRRGSS